MFFSEVAASLYPWDLADEGVDRILDNLESMTGCNSVYLIALMHHEKRPLTDFFYPHNPARKTYCPEDSRAYWRPDPGFYGRIAPLTSERALLRGRDWLQILVEAARARHMRTGVELSHTVLDAQRGESEYADCLQRDIFGHPIIERWGIRRALLCLNNPDARSYILGLFSDLVSRYDIDYIQTCLIPFDWGPGADHPGARVLAASLGGCWCEACSARAAEVGIDLPAIRAELLPLAESLAAPTLAEAHERALLEASNTTPTAVLLEHPALFEWLRFRRDSVTDLFRLVHERVHSIRPQIDLRLNAFLTAEQELAGLDLRALRPWLDSVRSSDYSEQSGDPARLEHKRRWLLGVRRAVGEDMHFLSAIGVRPRATPDIIRRSVGLSAECGADGITMGHYDGAPFANLRAVRQGMEAADVELLRG
jgi:hypothetical protein